MKTTARVVVIGGGVVGCSILYHLAKNGWTDVVLLERMELTSGSSWHAAGGLFTVVRPNAAAEIHKYTFHIYRELEKESGQDCGFHFTGGINICRSQEEMDSNAPAQTPTQAQRKPRRAAFHYGDIATRFEAPLLDKSS